MELTPFPTPASPEEARELVKRAGEMLTKATEIYNRAMGQAIRAAGRDGQHSDEIRNLLGISRAQYMRHLGGDDPRAHEYESEAAGKFLRLLSFTTVDDIAWTSGGVLYIEPELALRSAAACEA